MHGAVLPVGPHAAVKKPLVLSALACVCVFVCVRMCVWVCVKTFGGGGSLAMTEKVIGWVHFWTCIRLCQLAKESVVRAVNAFYLGEKFLSVLIKRCSC